MVGGTFLMGRSDVVGASDFYAAGDSDEFPEHNATVGPFLLDKYEVTVGRFRQFVNAYNDWRKAGSPKLDAGANSNVAAPTGWGQSWTPSTSDLPVDAAALTTALKCSTSYQNWTDTAVDDASESFPINCVTWYEAFAFCIWDGGRFPTEAEWECTAAGGSQNRLFPWGNEQSGDFTAGAKTPVGSYPKGAGAYGHRDLAGSLSEWTFDGYSETYYTEIGATCNNCANTSIPDIRAHRGGSFYSEMKSFRSASRVSGGVRVHYWDVGFRCARNSPP